MTNNEPMREGEPDFVAEPWDEAESMLLREEPDEKREYDLEDRTEHFGEAVIDFLKLVPHGPLTNRLIDQLVGCGTAVGANYCEADDAVSKKEFVVKISTCRKEARESKYFIRMVARACESLKPQARPLWREANELHLIFASIYRRSLPPRK